MCSSIRGASNCGIAVIDGDVLPVEAVSAGCVAGREHAEMARTRRRGRRVIRILI
jgi:hypothetical protein